MFAMLGIRDITLNCLLQGRFTVGTAVGIADQEPIGGSTWDELGGWGGLLGI